MVGLAAAGFGGLILLCVAGVSYAYAKTAVPTDVSQAAMQQQSTVYFSDGKTVVGTFGNTDRQLLQYNQISPLMRDAVVAAEDRSFYTEGGVSPKGIVRAAYEDVFNGGGSSGGSLQGGSTITQQFVRNYYANIGTEQTASRKVKEIFVALKVAKEKSKAWILTNYLNTIYLGQGAYGVGAAAETYFGIPASQVDAAQAAYIAAIIQSPSYYPTPAGQTALMTRWHYVLDGMVTLGDLSAQQAAAEHFPKVLSAQDQHVGSDPYDSYVLGLVDNELTEQVQVLAGPDRQWRAARHDHDQQVDDGPALQRGEPEREADGGRRRGAALVRAGGRGAAEPADRGHYGLLRRPRRERPGRVLPQHLLRQHRADPGAGGVVVQAVRTGYRGSAGHERSDHQARRLQPAVDPAGQRGHDACGPHLRRTRAPAISRRPTTATSPMAR